MRRIVFLVTNVAHEMFVHLLSILSLHRHLYIYKSRRECVHDEIHLLN